MTACSIPDCPTPVHSRGWCQMHATRWRRHGDPLIAKKIVGDELARFLKFANQAGSDCWLWSGRINGGGYPQFMTPSTDYAHRWSYAHFVAPIPSGYQVDHLCRVRHCVNPAHLEAVTQRENIIRSEASHVGNGLCRNRLHDVTDPANVHYFKNGDRTCLPCKRAAQAVRDARRREKAKRACDCSDESPCRLCAAERRAA